MEGMARAGLKPLRVGFQGNIRSSLLPHSLDFKLQSHHLYPTLEGVKGDADALAKDLRKKQTSYTKALLKIKESQTPNKNKMTRVANMLKDITMIKLRHKGIEKKIYAMRQEMLRDVVSDADVVSVVLGTSFPQTNRRHTTGRSARPVLRPLVQL